MTSDKTLNKIKTFTLYLAVFFFVLVLILQIASLNKVIFGVTLVEEKVGGLEKDTFEEFISKKIEEHKDVSIENKNQKWTASLSDLGFSVDKQATLNSAFSLGREKNIFLGIKTQVKSILFKNPFEAVVLFDDEAFEKYFEKNLAKIESPAKDAKFLYLEDGVSIKKEEIGTVIDKEKLKKELRQKVAGFQKEPVSISYTVGYPKINEANLNPFKNDVSLLLAMAPYSLLQNGEKKSTIDKDQIKELIKPEVDDISRLSLDKEKLKKALIQLSPTINRDPQNAVLTIKNGKVVEFVLSKDGLELEIEESADKIESNILRNEGEVELLIKKIPAEIRTETIHDLGIKEKIGSGVSDFSGSPKERVHNIKLGAEKINGVLVAPGEEFSFVKKLGEISKRAGYEPTYVIKDGVTIPEYGGGLCQVSTTTFRAAMYAGLEISERFPHSYPVAYYHPQGFDAAIYGPHPDLRFVNDTPANILIQAYVRGNKLYFDLYGTLDGREVKLTGPEVYESKPDGSLKTKLKREIFDEEGELLTTKTFWSNYKSAKLYPVQHNPLE